MIRHQLHPHQLRVDTTIKIINSDGTETLAPVVVLVNLSKVKEKHESNILKIANKVFNRDFIIDKRIQVTSPKKPWWKLW
jgi:hypothetical protein